MDVLTSVADPRPPTQCWHRFRRQAAVSLARVRPLEEPTAGGGVTVGGQHISSNGDGFTSAMRLLQTQ
ncbi:MAG: hypothetical protein U0528_12575 [Anaerolineae bacterium]